MPPPAEGLASRLFLVPALRTQPDRRLVALVRAGYESAFEEIVRRHGRPLGRYAASIVGGRSEDVLQDAFAKALSALRRADAEIELRPWLFRIVRNTALNDLRDHPPTAEVLAETIAGGGNPAEELERREELADLMRRLHALPERQRAAIVMRELEGLSHGEIAAALGLSSGGARQAIHRARTTLRNGIGMLVPLPLLKALLGGASPGAAEAATGVGAATGAGMAAKATVATVLLAGAVGAGVALHHGARGGPAEAAASPPAATTQKRDPAAAADADATQQASGRPAPSGGRASRASRTLSTPRTSSLASGGSAGNSPSESHPGTEPGRGRGSGQESAEHSSGAPRSGPAQIGGGVSGRDGGERSGPGGGDDGAQAEDSSDDGGPDSGESSSEEASGGSGEDGSGAGSQGGDSGESPSGGDGSESDGDRGETDGSSTPGDSGGGSGLSG